MTVPEISWLAILPELVLALGAAGVLLVDVQWKPKAQALGTVAAGTLTVAIALTVVQWVRAQDTFTGTGQLGDLVAFSRMMFMDGFAVFGRLAILVTTAFGLAVGWKLLEALGRRRAEAIALVFLSSAGFSIMVAANNLVMVFLGLEVGSIALYVLAGMTRDSADSDEAALKYFLLGSFASAIFIYGVALLYAGTGQFEILGIRSFFDSFVVTSPGVILIGIALMIVGLGFKVSAAPFHAWAPDVYQGAPAGFVGYMAAVAKIAGFAAIARVLITGLESLDVSWLPVVAAVSAVSMLGGSLIALVQADIRRMLAYSGVATAGFVMTGIVGGGTSEVLFYVTVYALQLLGSFAVVSAVSGPTTSGSSMEEYRGLGSRSPGLASGFTILLLGMAGLPLTSGFIAKFGVFSDAWSAGFGWLVIIAVLASVLAFAVYLRVIVNMYMSDPELGELEVPDTVRWVLVLAAGATIVWGILPGSLLDLTSSAFPL